jgi:CysZ protein
MPLPELPHIELTHGTTSRQFWTGFGFPFRGARLVAKTPDLWAWVLLPVLFMGTLIIGAGFLTWWWVPQLLTSLWAAPAAGPGLMIWTVVSVILWLCFFVVSTVLLYLCFGLLATPFYDQLSDKTETLLLGARYGVSWSQWWGDIGQSIGHSALAFGLWMVGAALTLMVSFVPVIGPILDVVLGGGITAFMLAREMMDGPMSRRRLSFRTKLLVVRENLPVTMGFGVATTLFLAIPLVNLFSLPCAVVGGTQLFVQLEKQGLLPKTEDTTMLQPTA